MDTIVQLIKESQQEFALNLKNRFVLTEAATGNYTCTAHIAAIAGATVFALAKDSNYGSLKEIIRQNELMMNALETEENITIVNKLEDVPLDKIDIVTNTGFVRPINKKLISKLPKTCVVPLMWEPWEFREDEIDLEACYNKGIKVYGTNEDDKRLRTKEYLGEIVFRLLSEKKIRNAEILIIGNDQFTMPIDNVLTKHQFKTKVYSDYNKSMEDTPDQYDAIVIAEHQRDIEIISDTDESLLHVNQIHNDTYLIHICGRVNLSAAKFKYIPENPAAFGYMSFRTDYFDPKAVVDLHTAGLKVAEGMLSSNNKSLSSKEYKWHMENNYPALAFENEKYW